MNLVVRCGFDHRDFTQMHRDTIVCNKRNADLNGVVISNGNFTIIERFQHVIHLNEVVEGVAEQTVTLLFEPARDDPFGQIASFVNCRLKNISAFTFRSEVRNGKLNLSARRKSQNVMFLNLSKSKLDMTGDEPTWFWALRRRQHKWNLLIVCGRRPKA